MIRLTQFQIPIAEVLPLIRRKTPEMGKREFVRNFEVNVTTQRLLTFKMKGTNCVLCGIKGKFFQLEKHVDSEFYHLALYAVNKFGHKILMTKDHIYPKSRIRKGMPGRDSLSNLQSACYKCNQKKGTQVL